MANEKEAIKKLLTIVAKQQKIITKLAQAADPRDPFSPSGLPGDPLDPTLPGDKPSAPAPAPKPAPKPAPTPKATPTSQGGGLDPEVKAQLDAANLPQLKGNLLVTPTGSGLKIDFNADRVKDRPSDLKAKLQQAGVSVTEIMGHMNPSWKANY